MLVILETLDFVSRKNNKIEENDIEISEKKSLKSLVSNEKGRQKKERPMTGQIFVATNEPR